MAKMTLYIPDDLNKRVKKAGIKDETNISALLQEVLEKEYMRWKTMEEIRKNASNTVSRLKESKEEYEKEMYDWSYQNGLDCGKTWAEEIAEYKDLVKISKTDALTWNEVLDDEFGGDNVKEWIDDIDREPGEELTDAFLEGFLKAAQNVWEEVKNKL